MSSALSHIKLLFHSLIVVNLELLLELSDWDQIWHRLQVLHLFCKINSYTYVTVLYIFMLMFYQTHTELPVYIYGNDN